MSGTSWVDILIHVNALALIVAAALAVVWAYQLQSLLAFGVMSAIFGWVVTTVSCHLPSLWGNDERR